MSVLPAARLAPARFYLVSDNPSDDEDPEEKSGRLQAKGEDLPYKVEIWDESGTFLELTVAVTANATIGYAAYFEALREYPERHVILRHKGRVLTRSNFPN